MSTQIFIIPNSFYIVMISLEVSIFCDRMKHLSVQAWCAVDEDTWPPNQPKEFIPLMFVYHQGQYTVKQERAWRFVETTGIHLDPQLDNHKSATDALANNTITNQLVHILAPLQDDDPQFILVEGLPGIGKSLLLQQIACEWGKGKLLQKFLLVILIQLRNPAVQQISLVAELFELALEGDTNATKIATACSNHIFKNKGKDIVFLFDGFDEFPEHLQKNSLIASILRRTVLPDCGLIVSSRPHASLRFHEQAAIRVKILGFGKAERKLYIEHSLKDQPHAVEELTTYLDNNLTINGLCFIPFNMVILIYLYKQGVVLPSSSTDLYKYFVYLTVCRHLAKLGHPLEDTDPDLANLPEPCFTIIKQLSKLSLEGLNKNKLIFTLNEMRIACPEITDIQGAVNGFGLLHTIQHNGLTGKTMTFNFIHFSIQEFLAAYHITHLLPHEEQLHVLNSKFWSNVHSNMFAMYTSLTKGQQLAFKIFLSDGDDTIAISEVFLNSQLKCFHLFRCFHEANDKTICRAIWMAKIFDDKVIDLSGVNLSIYDVECVTLFLSCSRHKKWKDLILWNCHIQDHGLYALHWGLMSSGVSIEVLDLTFNDLTLSSSAFVSDLTMRCGVKELMMIGCPTIGEGHALYDILSHSFSLLVELNMHAVSSSTAIVLFTALAKGNKLQVLSINNISLSTIVCNVIADTMKENTSLVRLRMDGKKISAEATKCIFVGLQHNNTLELLRLPYYAYRSHQDYSATDLHAIVMSLQEKVIKSRQNRQCQTKLLIEYWKPDRGTCDTLVFHDFHKHKVLIL